MSLASHDPKTPSALFPVRSKPCLGRLGARIPNGKPSKIGVLGAGMMGASIAHAAASLGIACVLKDVSVDKAVAGFEAVRQITSPAVAKGGMIEG